MSKTSHHCADGFIQRWNGHGVGAVLLRGASSYVGVSLLGTGIAFGVQIVLARFLGSDGYGYYIYPLTCINLLVLVAKLGFDTATLRFVTAYHKRAEWSLLHGFLSCSRQVTLGIALLLSGSTALILWCVRDQLETPLASAFWVACLLLPIRVLLELRLTCFRALKRVVLAHAPQVILLPLLLAGGVLLTFGVLQREASASLAMTIHVMASLVTLILSASYLRHVMPSSVSDTHAEYQTRQWIGVALPLVLYAGFYWSIQQTDILMIGLLSGSKDAGIYSAASRCVKFCGFGLTAANAIAAPMIAELYEMNRMKELQRLVTLAARGACAIAIPVSLGMIVFGRLILSLYGPDFLEAYTALVILTAGQLVNALVGSVGFLMTMTGNHREAARVLGVSAILNLVLNVILIPRFGINGAAIATAVSMGFWNLLMYFHVKNKLNITTTAFRVDSQR